MLLLLVGMSVEEAHKEPCEITPGKSTIVYYYNDIIIVFFTKWLVDLNASLTLKRLLEAGRFLTVYSVVFWNILNLNFWIDIPYIKCFLSTWNVINYKWINKYVVIFQ